jgi:hypothetical protein
MSRVGEDFFCADRKPAVCDCAQVAERLMAADCKSAAPWSYGGSNPPLCTTNCNRGGPRREPGWEIGQERGGHRNRSSLRASGSRRQQSRRRPGQGQRLGAGITGAEVDCARFAGSYFLFGGENHRSGQNPHGGIAVAGCFRIADRAHCLRFAIALQ